MSGDKIEALAMLMREAFGDGYLRKALSRSKIIVVNTKILEGDTVEEWHGYDPHVNPPDVVEWESLNGELIYQVSRCFGGRDTWDGVYVGLTGARVSVRHNAKLVTLSEILEETDKWLEGRGYLVEMRSHYIVFQCDRENYTPPEQQEQFEEEE